MSNREQPIQVNEISSTTGNNVEEDTASVTTVEWHAPDLFDSYTDSDTDSEPSYFHCRSPSPRDSPDGVDPSDEENRNSPRSPRQERFLRSSTGPLHDPDHQEKMSGKRAMTTEMTPRHELSIQSLY